MRLHFVAAVAFLVCCSAGVASYFPRVLFAGGSNNNLATNTANCFPASGFSAAVSAGTSENNINFLFHGTGATVVGLVCDYECAGGPGAGKSYAYTVRKNAADTAVTCSITGASTGTCTDSTHSVTFTADADAIDICATPSGTPAACQGMCSTQVLLQ